MLNRRTPLLALAAALTLGACSRSGDSPPAACTATAGESIVVMDAWIRPARGRPMTAAYLVLCNAGDDADALIAVAGAIADTFEIHRSSRNDAGVVSMVRIERVALPPSEIVRLEPGGAHVMVIGLHGAIEPGDAVPLTLRFQGAAPIEITAEARP